MNLLIKLSEGGEGANTALIWLLYAGVGFFFLTIAMGWLSSMKKQDVADTKDEASPRREAASPKKGKAPKRGKG